MKHSNEDKKYLFGDWAQDGEIMLKLTELLVALNGFSELLKRWNKEKEKCNEKRKAR